MSIRRTDPRETSEWTSKDPLAGAVVIRPAIASDAPAVRDLVVEVLTEFGLAHDPSGTDSDLDDIRQSYRRGGGEFWVVEDDRGRLVGTCGVWPDPDDRDRCELRKMYLLPEARGRGLGRRLLDLSLARARQGSWKRMELETHHTMTDAIGLYERAGFRPLPGGACASRCDRRFGMSVAPGEESDG